ncbi:MAG TPA: FAD-dependent oxidoreductase [Candidatus Lokiarchaeia archaeon]|nr:FAD-dependent oxidoreductase [Candidatus Lokiarchaeia archaeon]
MEFFNYLIIGGGTAAFSACHGIREHDSSGTIGIISNANYEPCVRPVISARLFQEDIIDDYWLNTSDEDVTLILSKKVTKIEPAEKKVLDNEGNEYGYDKLLIATGAAPRKIEPDPKGVIYFHTIDDYFSLKKKSEQTEDFRNICVVGGGFIGSEIAAALAQNGKFVTMLFPAVGILASILPASLAKYLNAYYKQRGIDVFPEEAAIGIEKIGREILLKTSKGNMMSFDAVIAGIGIRPEVGLAQAAGLQVGNGIIVDSYLRTSDPSIFAAGDVARVQHPLLGFLRSDHADNARVMGNIAGANMSGQEMIYDHLPCFYSELFDISYQAVGDVNSRFVHVIDWREEYKEGIIYYLSNGQLRGILSWNIPGQINAARSLIVFGANKIHNVHTLKSLLPV